MVVPPLFFLNRNDKKKKKGNKKENKTKFFPRHRQEMECQKNAHEKPQKKRDSGCHALR